MAQRPWDEGFLRRAWEETWSLIERRWVKVLAFAVLAVFAPAMGALVGAWEAVIALAAVGVFFLLALLASVFRAPFIQRNEARAERIELIDRLNAAHGITEPIPAGHMSIRKAVNHLVERREPGHAGKEHCIEAAASILERLAADGVITIWGCTKETTHRAPVPKSIWPNSGIDYADLLADDGSCGKTFHRMGVAGYREYNHLSVAFDDLKGPFWPEDKG